MSYVMKWTL